MAARYRVCTHPGCPSLVEGGGRCALHQREAERARRPNGNPYGTRGHQAFRDGVLAAHPLCQCMGECGKHDGLCAMRATVANHYPVERRDLEAAGLNPNDPTYGRGECKPCHDSYTARTSPGGWNLRE